MLQQEYLELVATQVQEEEGSAALEQVSVGLLKGNQEQMLVGPKTQEQDQVR